MMEALAVLLDDDIHGRDKLFVVHRLAVAHQHNLLVADSVNLNTLPRSVYTCAHVQMYD